MTENRGDGEQWSYLGKLQDEVAIQPDRPEPKVLSTHRGSLSLHSVQLGPVGTIELLDDGWARYRSDDGKTVTLVRKEALAVE